jgi:hypothetical protein
MKLIHCIGAVAALASGVFASADTRAASWSVSFKIAFMDGKAGDLGFQVVPETNSVANNSTNDPANCVPSDNPYISRFYLLNSNYTTEQRELLSRTLLSAFLAGKPVKLWVSETSTNCENNRPMYAGVSL